MVILARWRGIGTAALALIRWAMPYGSTAHGQSVAAPPKDNTYASYAAFTLNRVRFVSWPDASFERAEASFVIGTFPGDPIK